MTARPTDWSPLCAGDPVPGDWEEVQSLGKNIRAVADEIKAQSDKLRNLCTDGYWESDAGEKFDETAKDTATALSKAYARYDAAADALEYYYPKLKAEQEESLLVLADAQALESDRKSAQDRLDADDEAPDDPEAPERPGRADDQSTVGAYFGKLNALRDKVEACATAVRKAANNAADHIESVIDDDGLKDSRLDKMRNWVHEHVAPIAKVVAEWAGKIAAVFGLLALAVGWIPIIGQALAAVFGTIALVAGVISLVANLALWFSGDGGFGAVLLDMVGVLTFGVGRAAIAGLKGGVAALNATGKLATAATKIGAQVTARGGQMSTAVVNAIAKSDLRLASQLSHIPLSSLKGMVGGKLGGLAVDFGAGGFRHLDDVIKGAPQGLGKIPFPTSATTTRPRSDASSSMGARTCSRARTGRTCGPTSVRATSSRGPWSTTWPSSSRTSAT